MNDRLANELPTTDEHALTQRDRELANWIEAHAETLTVAAAATLDHLRELQTLFPHTEMFCTLLAEASNPHDIFAAAQFAVPLTRAPGLSEAARDAVQALVDLWVTGRRAVDPDMR